MRELHWFVITHDPKPPGDTPAVGHLLQSDDQGQTWHSTGLQSASNGISLIATTAHGPVVYVLATDQVPQAAGQIVETLWRFDDATGAWTALPPFPFALAPADLVSISVAVNPTTPSQLFVAFGSHVYQSRDGGITWSDKPTGLPTTDVGWLLLFDPSLANRLYAVSGPTPGPTSFWALDTIP